ncbi:MAG TPA: aldo/keto reductase [Syntrophorhabdaceae bacterium]|nr:aldo/keto reductase [Syntrophorhabdaceae bacterium]HQM82323.1 aldo/keto reductase [Syntrophorhabdaceae bacterium]
MANSKCTVHIKRRDFLKLGAVTASAAMGAVGIGGILKNAAAATGAFTGPVYRTLGKTGLKITVVSFGAMLTPEHEVMRAAFDLGVNYVDTARRYMNGRNEEIVAKAIKGIRDKIYVATKTVGSSGTRKEIFQDVETSLSRLQTDYIDVIQIHNVSSRERAFEPEVREAYVELRKQGKVRFFGVTTHTNQSEVLKAITDDQEKFFDMALVAYNFKSPPSLKEAIARAAGAGIGIVAMKTQAGGYRTDAMGPLSPHQAALKWVLQDTNVTAAIPGMKDMSMLKEDLSVMGMRFTRKDEETLRRYGRAIDHYYCSFCGQCEETCPRNVAISDIGRSLMYAEAYGSMELARSTYYEIDGKARASACLDCNECTARCVNGLDIARRMRRALTLYT